MTNDVVHCTEEELTNDPARFDGRRIEAVGIWCSGHFEDSTFAELEVVGAETFRYRDHCGRRFGFLEVRLCGRVDVRDPKLSGRRRGFLHVEHVEPLAEIVDADLTRGPLAITRETGFFYGDHAVMSALRYFPMKLHVDDGKAIVREGAEGVIEIVRPDGAVRPLVEGSALGEAIYFTRDRRSREAWSFLEKKQTYRLPEPPYVLMVDRSKEHLVVPLEGASYACSHDRIEQTTPDDEAANLEVFRIGDRYAAIAPRGELFHRHTFFTGMIVGVDAHFTAGNCAVRLMTKQAFEKR